MFKKTVSFTTLWSFIGMTVTGIVLFIIPEGRVAYWVDLKIIGLSKNQWEDLHTTLSALFMISGVLHIILNWNSIVYYMKNKAKKIVVVTPAFVISLFIFIVFIFGTYYKISPLVDLLNLSTNVKNQWKKNYGEPPFPHAELYSLEKLMKREGFDLQVVVKILKDNNIQFDNASEKFLDIARRNRLSPARLFDIIEMNYDDVNKGKD